MAIHNKYRAFYVIAIILIILGIIKNFIFIIPTLQLPASTPNLTIDSISFIASAQDIIEKKDLINLKNTHHPPGFQIFLACVLFIFGRNNIAAIKIIFCLLNALVTLLIIYMGEKFLLKGSGYLAGIFSALSISFMYYCGTVQYEILVTFLILMGVFVAIKSILSNRKAPFFIMGLIFSFICMMNSRFIILIPLIIFYFAINLRSNKKYYLSMVISFIIGSFLIIAPWSIYQSLKEKKIVIVHTSNSLRKFKKWNTAIAKGYNYPYPERLIEPNGINFAIRRPIKFLWLTKERFLYFWNFKDDTWKISFPYELFIHDRLLLNHVQKIQIIDKFISIVYFFIFIGGGILLFIEKKIMELPCRKLSILYIIIIGIMIVPLFVSASPRFCVPMLPYLYLLQAYLIVRGIRFMRYLKKHGHIGINLIFDRYY